MKTKFYSLFMEHRIIKPMRYYLILCLFMYLPVAKAQLSFTDSEQSFGTGYITNIAFGDVNRDGYPDAIVSYNGIPTKIWINDKLGHFTDSGQALSSEGGIAMGAAFGDLDNDGDLDAFIIYINASGSGKPNEVWINDGDGIFTNSGQKLGQRCSSGIALADLDNDGDLDAFVCNHLGTGISTGSQVWLNDRTGKFTETGQDLGGLNQNHLGVVVGDIDGDKDMDAIVCSGGNNETSKNELWVNDGKGNFTGKVLSTIDSQGLALGDIDNDGDSDILITYKTGAKIFLNDAKGNFTLSNQNFGTTGSFGVALGDLDKDGDLDAIIEMKGGTNSIIWINEGNGTFKENKINLLLGNGGSLRLIDLNNDGLLDVLAGSKIYFNKFENTGIVTDIDGNIYHTVVIGAQTWIKENLRATKYSNGDVIGTTSPATLDITNQTTPKYQWAYNGNEGNAATYGRLYTWYAVIDYRNICPTGWHVPTDSEWSALFNYLGGESIAGGKLKETGTTHWITPNTAATNESGFTALPSGNRQMNGGFMFMGYNCQWWKNIEFNTNNAYTCNLTYDYGFVGGSDFNKKNGFSVRCIKDIPSGTNESRNEGFEIFPNPTTGRLALSFGSNSLQQAQTEVYNTQGQMVFSKTFQNTSSVEFDISLFPKGIYVVKVRADEIHYESKVCLQ